MPCKNNIWSHIMLPLQNIMNMGEELGEEDPRLGCMVKWHQSYCKILRQYPSLAAPDPTTLKKGVWGNSIQQNVAPPECEWHQSDRSI